MDVKLVTIITLPLPTTCAYSLEMTLFEMLMYDKDNFVLAKLVRMGEGVIVFNATFNNISVISWLSALFRILTLICAIVLYFTLYYS